MEAPAGELLRKRLFGAEPGRREDARARMSTEEAPASTAQDVVEEDLRTLWIDGDDQGQRFKEWKKVCSESSGGTPGRQPGGGASFVPHGVQADAAPRRNPQVVDALVDEGARVGVSGKDRLYHEVSTLAEILLPGRHV